MIFDNSATVNRNCHMPLYYQRCLYLLVCESLTVPPGPEWSARL